MVEKKNFDWLVEVVREDVAVGSFWGSFRVALNEGVSDSLEKQTAYMSPSRPRVTFESHYDDLVGVVQRGDILVVVDLLQPNRHVVVHDPHSWDGGQLFARVVTQRMDWDES